jgi:quercetin dioxygenase-like cupin family protein
MQGTQRHLRAAIFGCATTAIVLACNDSTLPTTTRARSSQDGPQFTPGSGVTPTIIARGNIGAFHLQSKFEGYNIELKTHDNTDVQLRSAIASPGSYSGWHTHPGPVILVIKTGTLTLYDASDPSCQPKVYSAGMAFFEGTTPHNVRNEGSVVVEYGTVYFVPAGGPTRIEADFPPNCAP